MRVLLLGGSGQLGSEIRKRWSDCEIVAPSSAQVDIERTDEVEAELDRVRPDLLVNCTAFHNVEQCEREPERALDVNALAVHRLAAATARRDLSFVTYSTDYVFDGRAGRAYTEEDAPHPLSAYGVSKYTGELLVEVSRAQAYVVRTCGVYAVKTSTSKGYTFIDRILTQAARGEPLRVVSDQIVSPTYAGDLATMTRALVETGRYGLYHAASAGAVSWYDFAREALDAEGLDVPIEAVSSDFWPSPVRRPAYSALASAKLQGLAIAVPDWRSGLQAYLEERRGDLTG